MSEVLCIKVAGMCPACGNGSINGSYLLVIIIINVRWEGRVLCASDPPLWSC